MVPVKVCPQTIGTRTTAQSSKQLSPRHERKLITTFNEAMFSECTYQPAYQPGTPTLRSRAWNLGSDLSGANLHSPQMISLPGLPSLTAFLTIGYPYPCHLHRDSQKSRTMPP